MSFAKRVVQSRAKYGALNKVKGYLPCRHNMGSAPVSKQESESAALVARTKKDAIQRRRDAVIELGNTYRLHELNLNDLKADCRLFGVNHAGPKSKVLRNLYWKLDVLIPAHYGITHLDYPTKNESKRARSTIVD